MLATLSPYLYLASAVCCIMALRGLSGPESALSTCRDYYTFLTESASGFRFSVRFAK